MRYLKFFESRVSIVNDLKSLFYILEDEGLTVKLANSNWGSNSISAILIKYDESKFQKEQPTTTIGYVNGTYAKDIQISRVKMANQIVKKSFFQEFLKRIKDVLPEGYSLNRIPTGSWYNNDTIAFDIRRKDSSYSGNIESVGSLNESYIKEVSDAYGCYRDIDEISYILQDEVIKVDFDTNQRGSRVLSVIINIGNYIKSQPYYKDRVEKTPHLTGFFKSDYQPVIKKEFFREYLSRVWSVLLKYKFTMSIYKTLGTVGSGDFFIYLQIKPIPMKHLKKFKQFEDAVASVGSGGMGAVVAAGVSGTPGIAGTTGSGDLGFPLLGKKRKGKGTARQVSDARYLGGDKIGGVYSVNTVKE